MAFLCPFRLRPNQRKPGYNNKKYGSVKGRLDAIGAKLHGDAHLLSNVECHDEVIRALEAGVRCPADGVQGSEVRYSGTSLTFERKGTSYIVHPVVDEPMNERLSQVELAMSVPCDSNKENLGPKHVIGQVKGKSEVIPTEGTLNYDPSTNSAPHVVRDRSSYLQMLEDLIEEGPAGYDQGRDRGQVWSRQKGNRLFTDEELERRVGESTSKTNRLSYAMMLEGKEERHPAERMGTAGRSRVHTKSSPLSEEQLHRLRTLRRDRHSYLIMVDGLLDESRRSSVATSQRWSIATCSEDLQELDLGSDFKRKPEHGRRNLCDANGRRGRADGGPSSSTSPESSTSTDGSKPDIRRQRPRRKISANSNRGLTKSVSTSSTSTASTVFLDDKQITPPSGQTRSVGSRIGHRIVAPPVDQVRTAASKMKERKSGSSLSQASADNDCRIIAPPFDQAVTAAKKPGNSISASAIGPEDKSAATPSDGNLGERRGSISSISSAVAVVRSIQLLSPSEQAEQGSDSKSNSFLQTDLPPPTPFRDSPDIVPQASQHKNAAREVDNTVESTEVHSGKGHVIETLQEESEAEAANGFGSFNVVNNTAESGSGVADDGHSKTTSKPSLWRPYLMVNQERSKVTKSPLSDVTNLLWSNVLVRASLGASGGSTNDQQGRASSGQSGNMSRSMTDNTPEVQSLSTSSLAQYSLLTLAQGQARSPADPSPLIPPAPHTTPDLQVAEFQKQPIGQATVMFDFMAVEENDLSVMRGETVMLLNMDDMDWVYARTDDGAEGFIPRNFCSPCPVQNSGANVSDTSSLQLTMATKDATFLTCGTQNSSWVYDTIYEEDEEDIGEGRDAMATVSVEIQKLIDSALAETDQMTSHSRSKFAHPISVTPHLGTAGLAETKAIISMATSSLMNDTKTTAQTSFLSSIDLLDLTQDDPLHCYQPANEGLADSSSLPATVADETSDSVATSESAWPDEDLRTLVKQTHKFLVLYDFAAQAVDEVSVSAGELVYVDADKQQEDDWLWVYVPSSGDSGYIPQAFTRPIRVFDLK